MGFLVAQEVGCGHHGAFPVVVERRGAPRALGSFLDQLVKVLFSVKEATYNTLYMSFEMGAWARRVPVHSYFPMTLILTSFFLFSDKELKELAMNFSA